MLKFRPLHPAEILLKPSIITTTDGQGNKKSLTEFIPYKNARADMCILDECVGPDNWQRDHKDVDGAFMCGIGIYSDKHKQFIWKWDAGSSNGSADVSKASASDSFKRAGFSWGIGRELYTAPFIWISAEKIDIHKKADRYVTYDKFKVSSLSYNENREIKDISIVNQNGKIVYQLKSTSEKNTNEHIDGINQELRRTGIALDTVLRRYGVSSIEEMDENTYKKAMNSLKRTKPKAA